MSKPEQKNHQAIQSHKQEAATVEAAKAALPELPPVDVALDQRDVPGARIWLAVWAVAFAVLFLQVIFDLFSGVFR